VLNQVPDPVARPAFAFNPMRDRSLVKQGASLFALRCGQFRGRAGRGLACEPNVTLRTIPCINLTDQTLADLEDLRDFLLCQFARFIEGDNALISIGGLC